MAIRILTSFYHQATFRLAIRILQNREDAEDALQEAKLKAYCKLCQFQGKSRFYTWLVRITINQAFMKLRCRRWEREVPFDELIESEKGSMHRELEDWSNYPETSYAEKELDAILENALRSLSPRQRTAFYLSKIEELSVEESAAILGLSTNGLKACVSRARSKLREGLRGTLSASFKCSRDSRRAFLHDLAEAECT